VSSITLAPETLYFLVIPQINLITVAAHSTAWTIFARSNTGIVGSNPTWDMDICVCVYSLFVLSCVLCWWVGRFYSSLRCSVCFRRSLCFNCSEQLLVYADNLNLLGDNVDSIKKNTETLIDASKEAGLEVLTVQNSWEASNDESRRVSWNRR
jgi:hypothetical protein